MEKDYVELQLDGSGMSHGTVWGDLMESAISEWFARDIVDKSARILDFGCGEGRGLAALRKLGFTNVVGLDLNPTKVKLCRDAGFNAWCGDLLSIAHERFDYIFTSHTLEHTVSMRESLYLLSILAIRRVYYIVPVRETREFVAKYNPSHVSFIDDPKDFVQLVECYSLRHSCVELTRLCPELWGVIECRSRSPLRVYCDRFMASAARLLKTPSNRAVRGRALYVGVAGDPLGGEYSPLFDSYDVSTFDKDSRWRPDIVGDITCTSFSAESWDLIICSNVIEHIPNLHSFTQEISRILRPGGLLIIDCPWVFPYHGELPFFGDYWRISLDGLRELFVNFEPLLEEQTSISTHALLRLGPTKVLR